MTFKIRVALLEDLPVMIESESIIFGTDAWPAEMMVAEVSHPTSYYLVALEPQGMTVVGYAGIRWDPIPGGHADIQTVAVLPDHRGKGLGRTMVKALIARAAESAARSIFLEVRADNEAAISLYTTEGFDILDRRVGYYQPDGVDALVMRKELVHDPAGWAVGCE
jgi:ribosomal-protein-alanine acetyltransferase